MLPPTQSCDIPTDILTRHQDEHWGYNYKYNINNQQQVTGIISDHFTCHYLLLHRPLSPKRFVTGMGFKTKNQGQGSFRYFSLRSENEVFLLSFLWEGKTTTSKIQTSQHIGHTWIQLQVHLNTPVDFHPHLGKAGNVWSFKLNKALSSYTSRSWQLTITSFPSLSHTQPLFTPPPRDQPSKLRLSDKYPATRTHSQQRPKKSAFRPNRLGSDRCWIEWFMHFSPLALTIIVYVDLNYHEHSRCQIKVMCVAW